ncbi:hypothetical protein PENFLA_c099G01867 [Penicillium flavigenum]|uniref:Cyanovirin-N domain-containing protein n=1 Tax=Penicillium flavigenum TaxID=254877 RepID=A0A1V6S779_9EURO|nr:hypothetical protein PENFLA_c099G01867 [Penicillium flavigenum]
MKSFIADDASYKLVDEYILQATLKNDSGEEVESTLDLRACLGHLNNDTLDWWPSTGGPDEKRLLSSAIMQTPFIHNNKEFGPMLCVDWHCYHGYIQQYGGGDYTGYSHHKGRVNLAQRIGNNNGQLQYADESCIEGKPEPVEKWRLYFDDDSEILKHRWEGKFKHMLNMGLNHIPPITVFKVQAERAFSGYQERDSIPWALGGFADILWNDVVKDNHPAHGKILGMLKYEGLVEEDDKDAKLDKQQTKTKAKIYMSLCIVDQEFIATNRRRIRDINFVYEDDNV